MLCKALSAIGFQYGFSSTGSVSGGALVALAGLGCSVASSGMAFCTVMHLYEKMESCTVFQVIKKWIRPVISGLLLSVLVSVCKGNLRIAETYGWKKEGILFLMIVEVLVLLLRERKCRHQKHI